MTEPIYYDNPMVQRCKAVITTFSEDRRTVVLDRTCFYPEGGGQPGDRGTVDHLPVTGTTGEPHTGVLHHLEKPLPADYGPGSTVEAALDWSHRYEYMQQHTGQHLLSGALYRVAEITTMSVHQGAEVVTIEVDAEDIPDSTLQLVEDEANRVIALDRRVRTFEVDHADLARYSLRRPTERNGTVRLVEIEDFDLVACGGVHLPRTGLLNVVKTVGSETIRGRRRLSFKIGDRALADYRLKHQAITTAAELFSSRADQVPDRIRSTQEELQSLHRTVRKQAQRIASLLLPDDMEMTGPFHLVLEDEVEEIFKALAERATEDPRRRIALVNVRPDAVHWAIVVGPDYPFPQQEIRERVLKPASAKGGGKPPLWRGVIPGQGNRRDDREEARRFIKSFIGIWE